MNMGREGLLHALAAINRREHNPLGAEVAFLNHGDMLLAPAARGLFSNPGWLPPEHSIITAA